MSLLEAHPAAVRDGAPRQFQTLTVVALVLLGLSAAWVLVDPRMVDGAAVGMKPLKFALSFAVLFATLSSIEPRLSRGLRDGWTFRVIGWVMATAFLSEMAYMIYQGALAEPSHFNLSTPFHAFMYTVVMATGAVLLVLGVGLIGWLVQRDRTADLGDGLRTGIVLGFGLTFVLTMITAGYLSTNGSHFVGQHPDGGAVLQLFGWSGVTGDLRPAHFAALHAMQALPLLGLWLDRRGSPNAARTVGIAALGYGTLTMIVFTQATLGLPLIPLG